MDVVTDSRSPGGTPGPQTGLEDEWRAELVGVGYSRSSVADAIQYWRALDRWMSASDFVVAELTEARIDEFVACRGQSFSGAVAARRWLGHRH